MAGGLEGNERGTGRTPSVDGRLARGMRTRRSVAEALVGLLEDGVTEPTARQVAEAAGVSLRLVFHHFADMEDLYREICQLQLERYWSDLPRIPADLPLEQRVGRLVDDRSTRFEQVSAIRRAGIRRADRSPVVASIIEQSNRLLRRQLEATFGPELAGPHRQGDELLEALDGATSWAIWEQLRRHQALSAPATCRVMSRTVTALLETALPFRSDVAARRRSEQDRN